ncbi:Transcription initiation factor TFIID subunit 3 [Fasciola gigantica]|uniref:Transcription initiation factor TFIID subunit 3 n=1 Tax=Fasciola gigantica TaxID=46835 RepID=A0A504YX35_FASGI|nr:Transcription initiation factor TFIID subunit 3 [Fasciola gigantica]
MFVETVIGRKDRESREHERRRTKIKRSSPSKAKLQQALDAYEREIRREAKRKLELSASGVSAAANNSEFWLNVAQSQGSSDRWGHDGWEELQRPGPPITESFISYPSESIRKQTATKTPAPKLPVADSTAPFVPLSAKDESNPQNSFVTDRSKIHKRNRKDKKKHKKDKKSVLSDRKAISPKGTPEKRKKRESRSSSISTIHSDEELEWLERK